MSDDLAGSSSAAQLSQSQPTVVRRRRRILRHTREKTPEPSAKGGGGGGGGSSHTENYSDDENSSTADVGTNTLTKITTNTVTNKNDVRESEKDVVDNVVVVKIPGSPLTNRNNNIQSTLLSHHQVSSPSQSDADTKPKLSAHRSKILSRRDRNVGGAIAARSHSTPRNEAKVIDLGITSLIRHAKRSLSSPRHKDDYNDDNNDNYDHDMRKQQSPTLHHHYSRDTSVPTREILPTQSSTEDHSSTTLPDATVSPGTTSTGVANRELTKLERNLRRFEEERRRFELERRKFDKEKRDLEKARCARLEEFERRRVLLKNEELKQQQNAHDKLYSIMRIIEDSKNHLPSILKNEKKSKYNDSNFMEENNNNDGEQSSIPSTPLPTEDEPLKFPENNCDTFLALQTPQPPPESPICVADDYESSTALSSSSREGDFDDDGWENELLKNQHHQRKQHRTKSITKNIETTKPIVETKESLSTNTVTNTTKQSFLSRFFKRKKIEQPISNGKEIPVIQERSPTLGPVSLKQFLFVETRLVWRKLIADHPIEWQATMRMRNKCIADLIVFSIFCGLGGMVFRFVEGAFENFYKCGVRRVKRDFVDNLWYTSHNLREEDWKTLARTKLRKFEEELHTAHEAGMTSYSGMKAWTFINGMIYCMTVVTTIGYGHIYPSTNTGRAITIAYAIIGIPMFLILLADFGKLFTRGIKFLWAYVRRLYYTGSLRKVRKQAQVQEVLRGMNMAYEIATFRRPSVMLKDQPPLASTDPSTVSPMSHLALPPQSSLGTPTTPVPTEIDIDDEFNLPISLAFIILLGYIFCGAAVYSIWEEWSFFESCYFVFISMSTIGFGDYVPKHPIYMMTSIIYLVFGLALTSMCINVVQVKLSDSFRQASAKIGATIGLSMAEEEALASQNMTPNNINGDNNNIDNIPGIHGQSTTAPAKQHDDNGNKINIIVNQASLDQTIDDDLLVTAKPPPLLPKKKNSLVVSEDEHTDSKNDLKKLKKKSK